MPKIIDGDVLNYLQNKIKDNYANKDGDLHLQEKELNYSNEVQTIVPDTGYNGISKVTLPGLNLENVSVKSTSTQQVITPEVDQQGRDSYFKQVTVQPRTLQEKSIDIAAITGGTPFTPTVVTPDAGYNGLSKVTATSVVNMQSKTANYSNTQQEITADEGYSGLSSVTLQPDTRYYFDKWGNAGYQEPTLVITDDNFYPNDLKRERTIILYKYEFIKELQSDYITTLHLKRSPFSTELTKRIGLNSYNYYYINPSIKIINTPNAEVDIEVDQNFTQVINPGVSNTNYSYVDFELQAIYGTALSVKDYGFCYGTNVTNLPPIKELGKYAFYACKFSADLELYIMDNITEIKEATFKNSGLKLISLGPDISTIDNEAFKSSSLQTITVRGNSSCTTATILQTIPPSNYNYATIVYTEE